MACVFEWRQCKVSETYRTFRFCLPASRDLGAAFVLAVITNRILNWSAYAFRYAAENLIGSSLMAFFDALLPISGKNTFPELTWLENVALQAPAGVRVETLTQVVAGGKEFPVLAIVSGPEDVSAPTFGLFAGVHGLERIGTHVALAFLESIFARVTWDKSLANLLKRVRLVAVPLVNPGGMFLHRRANPNGVDIMRNAPVEADARTPFLLGGHRLGSWLPWYRGPADAPLEQETSAIVDFVEHEVIRSKAALTLDIHSGFGGVDRLWFPYARTRRLFPGAEQVRAFKRLLDASYPHHVYWIEQQSDSYTASGDVWDYIYERWRDSHAPADGQARYFVPWTLEMGSWTWIRKNPRQIFSTHGPFNPMKPHRYERILRRHMFLLEFCLRAIRNHKRWFKRRA